MKLSLNLVLIPIFASPWAAANGNGCNADNCLRALRNPTRTAAATSFCNSYTASVVTATTSLPTVFATACGSGPTQSSRLSSACSCYVSAAPPSCGDTSSDSNNCGTCGNKCPTGTSCSSGACVCTNSGNAPCNGQCPDLTSDNSNCGTCGNACASGTTCQSGTCAAIPGPGSCANNYTASCTEVVNSIMASNSIVSPDLVDLRIQSAQLGITSPADFLAALGPDPCATYTDANEHDVCVALLADSAFVSALTDIVLEVLASLQTCAADVASGAPDHQLIINDPTCPAQTTRRGLSSSSYDLTSDMLQEIDLYRRSAEFTSSFGTGPAKPSTDLLALIRRQANSCAQTGTCFELCPDCRKRETYCGTSSIVLVTGVCGLVGVIANAAVTTLATAGCTAACAAVATPLIPFCIGFCPRAAGGLSALAVGTVCAVVRNAICTPLTEKCANCNSANNGICNADSTQCCPGETGTQCGTNGCCCCPRCEAPGGINCACTAAPC